MTRRERAQLRQAITDFMADDEMGWQRGMGILAALLGEETKGHRLARHVEPVETTDWIKRGRPFVENKADEGVR